jgi:hypothetical protein
MVGGIRSYAEELEVGAIGSQEGDTAERGQQTPDDSLPRISYHSSEALGSGQRSHFVRAEYQQIAATVHCFGSVVLRC